MLQKQKWFRALFRRRILIALLVIVQAGFLIWLIVSGSRLFQGLQILLQLLSLLMVLTVVSRHDKGAYKLLWVILILTFPIFGGLLYLIVRQQGTTKAMEQRLCSIRAQTAPLYRLPGDGYDRAKAQADSYFPQVRYLQDYAGFPVYDHSSSRYFCPGEQMHAALLEDLQTARQYIFLEFFIVQEGKMWNSILEILRQKAAQGVQVRLIYDDMGCFLTLPVDYAAALERDGIQCAVFNPFRPFLTTIQNNRDHRKIAVIDGRIAYTGGINLADEYINAYEKYGHWKDSAIRVEGKAAWSFTLMFLEMWQLCKGTTEPLQKLYPWQDTVCAVPHDGLVLPYADSPMDRENVGEHVYLQILGNAREYVYINTPYLIIDDSMISALCLAAKRGVDVRIVTPGKWDKWAVHMTTRSYYSQLLEAGVRVYEYTPGFIHAKSFLSDDRIGTVGTVNLDFRSLYLHFECGAWLCDCRAVAELKEDFIHTLQQCRPVTAADCKDRLLMKLLRQLLRLFAPLM